MDNRSKFTDLVKELKLPITESEAQAKISELSENDMKILIDLFEKAKSYKKSDSEVVSDTSKRNWKQKSEYMDKLEEIQEKYDKKLDEGDAQARHEIDSLLIAIDKALSESG